MIKIKVVIFDLDNTLYDEKSFIESGFRAASRYIEKRFGIDKDEFFKVLMDIFETQGRGHNFDIALARYNLFDKKLVQSLVRVYRSHKPELKLYPGVFNILRRLRNKKLFLGLITDGLKTVQRNKVQSLDISELFDLIIYTDELGKHYQKPSKYPYGMMLEYFGISAEEALYVGDNPRKDFLGARELGLKTFRVLKGEYRDVRLTEDCDAHCSINEISELLKFINPGSRNLL